MPKEIKFSKEEMEELKKMQNTYLSIQNAYGQLGMGRLRLEQEIENMRLAEEKLKAKFSETQNEEKDFVDKMTKKYGDGNLNLETGKFTPKETPKPE